MNRTGFTLIEVLVSLAIVSIVLTALYSVFFLSRQAVTATDESLVKLMEARGLMDNLRKELESAFYTKDRPDVLFQINDRDYFGRQTSQITFATFSTILPALARVSYLLEGEGERIRIKKNIVSAVTPSGDTKDIVLMKDIDSFLIEAKYDGRWMKTWDSNLQSGMPEEVRIQLTIRIGPGQKQITLSDVVRPLIGRPIQNYLGG